MFCDITNSTQHKMQALRPCGLHGVEVQVQHLWTSCLQRSPSHHQPYPATMPGNGRQTSLEKYYVAGRLEELWNLEAGL